MSEDIKNIDQIEKYILEELKGEELDAFKQQLKADEKLASDTDLVHDLIKGIRKKGESNLEKTISEVHSKLKTEGFFEQKEAKIQPFKSSRKWLSYAAAIAVLIASTVWFFDWKQDQNIQMAMDAIEIEKLPELENIMDSLESFGMADDDRERKNNLLNIIELSKEKSLEEIKKAFYEHIAYYPRDGVAKLLFAKELLDKNMPTEAINKLNSLSNDANFQYQNLAKLTLAKAHLKIGKTENIEAAKALFQSLSLTKEKDYSNLAKQILETLD